MAFDPDKNEDCASKTLLWEYGQEESVIVDLKPAVKKVKKVSGDEEKENEYGRKRRKIEEGSVEVKKVLVSSNNNETHRKVKEEKSHRRVHLASVEEEENSLGKFFIIFSEWKFGWLL